MGPLLNFSYDVFNEALQLHNIESVIVDEPHNVEQVLRRGHFWVIEVFNQLQEDLFLESLLINKEFRFDTTSLA